MNTRRSFIGGCLALLGLSKHGIFPYLQPCTPQALAFEADAITAVGFGVSKPEPDKEIWKIEVLEFDFDALASGPAAMKVLIRCTDLATSKPFLIRGELLP